MRNNRRDSDNFEMNDDYPVKLTWQEKFWESSCECQSDSSSAEMTASEDSQKLKQLPLQPRLRQRQHKRQKTESLIHQPTSKNNNEEESIAAYEELSESEDVCMQGNEAIEERKR